MPIKHPAFWPLLGLAETSHAVGDYREALRFFREALGLARGVHDDEATSDILPRLAEVLIGMEEKQKALSLLAFFLAQPSLVEATRERATRLHTSLAAELPMHIVTLAEEEGSTFFESLEQLLGDA